MSQTGPAHDHWLPLTPEEHQRQLSALGALCSPLASHGAWGLDIGCGDGRLARPMATLGMRVLAFDRDEEALAACAHERITTRQGDVLDPALDLSPPNEPAACAWCLGNTFLMFHEVNSAAGFMRRLRQALAPRAWFAIDAFCEDVWADVGDGSWQAGVSEDGQWQLVWGLGDNVIALRRGAAVDRSSWAFKTEDVLLRLWSMGELTLLAQATGWRGPRRDETGAVLLFEKPG